MLKHNKPTKQFNLMVESRKTAAIFFALAISISTFAYNQKNSPDWKLNASVKNVDFYYSLSECNGKKVVFLKFINKGNKPVTIAFKEAFKTSAGTEEMAFNGKKKITIKPGETFAQSCSANTCTDCIVLPEKAVPTHKIDVQQFEFKDIEVNTP